MYSRDIHSRDGGKKVRDLLASFLGILLIDAKITRPIYLISPWLSDFKLLDNTFGQFKDLFRVYTNFSENPHVLFSETLIEISQYVPIRIITWPDKNSKIFVSNLNGHENIHVQFEIGEKDHQKGLLSDLFYFEGSMNFTYSGVYRNKEKISCNTSYDKGGKVKISEAYFEFERSWENLKSQKI